MFAPLVKHGDVVAGLVGVVAHRLTHGTPLEASQPLAAAQLALSDRRVSYRLDEDDEMTALKLIKVSLDTEELAWLEERAESESTSTPEALRDVLRKFRQFDARMRHLNEAGMHDFSADVVERVLAEWRDAKAK
jgi:hypothetical protein